MRQTATYPIDNLAFWKKQLLLWTAGTEFGVYLDSNGYKSQSPLFTTPGWECLAAANAAEILETNAGTAFEQLKALQQEDWLFGFFGYDLKNEVEKLSSQNFDGVGMPDIGFFRPKTVAGIKAEGLTKNTEVSYLLEIQTLEEDADAVFQEIKHTSRPSGPTYTLSIQLQARIPKPEYLQIVETIRQHIAGGDIYEMNFCQEFFAENASLDPLRVFERLNSIGNAPFSTFLRWRDRYLLSASPERFLKKEGQKLISQPIKGTRRRGKTEADDELIRQELASSEKDRSENVMIVDLVRNDFSRNCLPGSVVVEELCGIYTFATVHQMISTVSGVLGSLESLGSLSNDAMTINDPNDPMTNDAMTINDPNDPMTNDAMTNDPNDAMTNDEISLKALRDCFPMGSMTGAPKVMAMELIERYERSRRGLYSGAVGYFDPNGDFDFNVVIRSVLYNASTGYVSTQVGGAIVFDSIPEQEYEECMVKVDAMMRALCS